MFGTFSSGIQAYKRIDVETGIVDANPHRLIVMLYDGAIEACQSGLMHMQQGHIEQKGEALSKAIMIIESGLRRALDKSNGAEIAASLDQLYGYMSNRLYLAHLRNEPKYILETVKLLNELRSAWSAIADAQSGQTAAVPAAQATLMEG